MSLFVCKLPCLLEKKKSLLNASLSCGPRHTMLCGRQWILDGGLASTLQDSGYSLDGHPLWSARLLAVDPQAIKKVNKLAETNLCYIKPPWSLS